MAAFILVTYSSDVGEGLLVSYIVAIIAAAIMTMLTSASVAIDTWSALTPLFLVTLGPFGALVAFFWLGLTKGIRVSARDLDWLLEPTENSPRSDGQICCSRIRALRLHELREEPINPVVPLADIMRWGTLEEKQRALNQIVRNFSAEFLPAMQVALNDGNTLVRVQAASTMATLETRFVEKELNLRACYEKTPTDLARVRDLAISRAQRATSGLVSVVEAAHLRTVGIEGLKRFVDSYDRQPEDVAMLIRLMLEDGQLVAVRPYLRMLLRSEPTSGVNPQDLIGEWLYRSKKFTTLRRYLSLCSEHGRTFLRDHHHVWLNRMIHAH